ncbi:MAG: hypothetical protein GX221_10400 [Candidatus Riflebacteria bacterium]|nr:hypothetical protein [Candidatus Riflebacteria bacterium]
MTNKNLLFIATLTLSFAIISHTKANLLTEDREASLPKAVKKIISGSLYKKAEELLHSHMPCEQFSRNHADCDSHISSSDCSHHKPHQHNSEDEEQTGSLAGNREVLPLFSIAMRLDPQEIVYPMLLAENLAFHCGRKKEAVKILQEAIINNKKHPALHELYASLAFVHAFSQGKPETAIPLALRFLEKAEETYTPEAEKYRFNVAYTLENYAELKQVLKKIKE